MSRYSPKKNPGNGKWYVFDTESNCYVAGPYSTKLAAEDEIKKWMPTSRIDQSHKPKPPPPKP